MPSFIDPEKIILKPVTVTFLEMHQPTEQPEPLSGTGCVLMPKPISVTEYRKLYYAVGEKWHWLDRMVMPDNELAEKINAENVAVFIFYVHHEPAGFTELVKENKYVEIQYFGLMPAFTGKGLGNYFLQWVIAKAWSYHPEWIQLNTCTLDHPNALPVYKRAGFTIVKTEVQQRRWLTG
jgi:GNAT superfamily N-acetyltransferase